ncbi:unnamed protein product, partial [Choristocarpus tenellus]
MGRDGKDFGERNAKVETGLGGEEGRKEGQSLTGRKELHAADTGLEAFLRLLKSLGDGTRMAEMAETVSRRAWLSDMQIR